MPEEPTEPRPSYFLRTLRGRKPVIAVGGTSVRLINKAAYQRYVSRSINIAPWKRAQFSSSEVCCVACGWRPPLFLTDRHKRTFLTIHHLVAVADEGNDLDDNLIILCPNCHCIADYLPSIIVMPLGVAHRSSLIEHLQLLNNDPASWKRQYDIWRTQQKRKAVYALRDADTGYDGSIDVFLLS